MANRNSTTKTAPSSIPSEGKYTCHNRETMDYDGYFNGQYLGSRENMNAARDLVNEYVYDLERSGDMYTAEQLDGGASVEAIAADAPADFERRREIFRLFDQALGLTDEPEIEVTHLYRDASKGNDLTDQPVGPIAYTDYTLGSDATRALISIDIEGDELHEIIMQGEYIEGPVEEHLATMEVAIANMRKLLADPRVQAARVRSEALVAV